LAALADRRVRGEFKTWRDGFAATPRKADFAWTVLARIMSFAKDRGSITTNPCERGGRLYVADRADKLWGEQEIAALLAVASPEIKLAQVWHFGPGNAKVICCGCRGLHMMAAIFDFANPRQAGA
jgi:hypothetical protein